MSIERENYQYSDFLLDCRNINVHEDIARAVWHLSRNLMESYNHTDYKPFLSDDLCESFFIDYEDVEFEIIEKAFIGLNCNLKKDDKKKPDLSEYSEYSIINILKRLDFYCRSEQ